jgi:hypothetical protein
MKIYQAFMVDDEVEIECLEIKNKQDLLDVLNCSLEPYYDADARVGIVYAGTKKDILCKVKKAYNGEIYTVDWKEKYGTMDLATACALHPIGYRVN